MSYSSNKHMTDISFTIIDHARSNVSPDGINIFLLLLNTKNQRLHHSIRFDIEEQM